MNSQEQASQQEQDQQALDPAAKDPQATEEVKPQAEGKEKGKGGRKGQEPAVLSYITTEKVRSRSGRLRNPLTGDEFTRHKPVKAECPKGGWLESQVQLGLIAVYE